MRIRQFILIAASALLAQGAWAGRSSLDSTAGISWEICPQEDIAGVDGSEGSTPGFAMPAAAVPAVVPGCVFTSYVEAGREENPDYADNIHRVYVR